jgi:hypothetical protein
MALYQPGSFTKNYGWNQSPPGLYKLHQNIRRGSEGQPLPVKRDEFRARHGPGPELVAVNFFLHNTIKNGVNYVTPDELVRQALSEPHSRSFDQLALFALHLGRVGERAGHTNGRREGAAFANDYARNRLWNGAGWSLAQTAIEPIKKRFNETVIVTAENGDAGKTATNYHFMLEQAGLTGQSNETLNTRWPDWIGSAAFLMFDRVVVDEFGGTAPPVADLEAAAKAAEFHKLIGAPESDTIAAVRLLAAAYRNDGGFDRPWAGVSQTARASVPPAVPVPLKIEAHVHWSDEAAIEAEYVERRRREVAAQVRNPRNINELKALYANRCLFCDRRIMVGVDPDKFYSEAAHIRPLGRPHNGPDVKSNMMLLCPEHHLQFDRGILRLRHANGKYQIVSRVPADPLDGVEITLSAPHELDAGHTDWHFDFWR